LLPRGRHARAATAVAADAVLEIEVRAAFGAAQLGQHEREQRAEQDDALHPCRHESRARSCSPPSAIRHTKKTPANTPAGARSETAPLSAPRRSAQRQVRNAAPDDP